MERVPAGSVFRAKMIYTLYKDTDLEKLKNVFLAMEILEDSTLGGSGSRGSGRVRFNNFDIKFRSKLYYTKNQEETKVTLQINGTQLTSTREIKENFDTIFDGVKKTVESITKNENVQSKS
jgi:CRISPR-associated protein Csm3